VKSAQTVLIITDAENIHSGIGWLLQKRGYRAVEVAGRAALNHIRHETPNLVLIDSDHPLPESLALARSLSRQPDLADTQIIIITSDSQINSQRQKDTSARFIDRNDSASLMSLLSNLDSVSERPLRRAHRA
jgi:CheY-like chemotaxis protein